MQKLLRSLALLALLVVPWAMQAQNAKVSEYDGSVSTATYASIASTGTAWTAADRTAGYVDVSMPFAMQFGESQIAAGSTLRVSADGSASFTSLAGSRLAPLYYSAGYTTTATSVYTKGSAQQLVVEWRKVVSGQNSYSFQLQLYPNGDIEFRYGPMTVNGVLNVFTGLMSSDEDVFRARGEGGTLDWNTLERATDYATRTLSSNYAPDFDIDGNQGVVYTFTQPACVKPTSATATATAWNTIKVDWTVSSPGNSYEIKYSTDAAFDPDEAGTSVTVGNGQAVTSNITGLAGSTTYYIYVRKVCSGTPSGWSPKATATTLPGCYDAIIPSVTPNGVVTWTSPNEMVTSYNLKYGPAGFSPATEGTAVNNITALTYTIPASQLASATTYDVWLSTNCSVSGQTTSWVGPVSFTTPCLGTIAVTAAAPYQQQFADGVFPMCWTEEVLSGSDTWMLNDGYVAFTYTPGASSQLATPLFGLNPAGAYQVEFDHFEADWSGTCDSLVLFYRTTANGEWVRLAQYGNHADGYAHEIVLLPSPSANYQLAFVSKGMDGNAVYLTNVVVRTQPTCKAVTALTEVSHTGTSVTLSWTENGTATAWQICLDGDESNLVNATSNPFTLTGLTAEQTYTVKVRANCAADDQGDWSNTISVMPTNSATLTVNDGTTTNEYVPVYGYWADNNSRSQFVIPASQLTAMQWGNISKLTFYSSNSSVSWGSAQFNVYMAPAASTTVSSLANWNDLELVYSGSLSINDGVMEVVLNTPYQYIGGDLLIGINQTVSGTYSRSNWYGVSATGASLGGYGSSISQRNFLPKTTFNYIAGEPVTCFKPNGLAASEVTPTSATLTWTELGATTQWEVKYGPAGFDPFEEGISVMVNTTPSLTLGYLTPTTGYEAYVRAICDPEGPTEWSNMAEFTTTCPNGGNVEIGTAGTTNNYLPTYSYYNYSWTQQIYTAAEIGGAMVIDNIAFEVTTSRASDRNVTIYLGETDKDVFTSATDWIPASSMTQVYTGTLVTTSTGWQKVAFDTPFSYTGTGNLVVAVDDNTGSYVSSVSFRATNCDGNKALRVYSDPTNYDPNVTTYNGTLMSVRNDIRIELPCVVPCAAPEVAITLSDVEYAATLAFTNMNEDVTNPTYGIVWGPQGFNPETAGTTVSPISASTYTLSNLAAQTTYDVYVYSICSGDNGDKVRYSFTTPFIPNCKTPNTIAAGNVTYNTADLTWNQPGDVPLTWTVRYATADFDPATAAADEYTELTVTGSTTPAAQLTGLVAGTTYYVYIKSTCSVSPVDESPWSLVTNANPAFTFTTPACVAPTAVAVSEVTNSTAKVSWTEAGNATAWTLVYGISGFDPDNEGTAVAATTASIELTGLDAYADYEVYVKSNCTATDESDWSAAATFRTVCPDGGDVVIPGVATSSQYQFPVNNYYRYSYSQQIITAEEIGSAKPINGIRVYYDANDNPSKSNVIVSIGYTDKEEFSGTADWVDPSTLTAFYESSMTFSNGWNEIVFPAPFEYTGTGNIVIAFDDPEYGYDGSSSSKFAMVSTTGYKAMYFQSDSYNVYDGSNLRTASGRVQYRAKMELISPCNSEVTCFAPASVSTSVADDNAVTVTWTARTDLRPVVNNFELKYGLEGFNPETSGTLVADLNNVFTYIITGVDYERNYDVYVRTVCGEGADDHSKWTKAGFTTYPSCWAPTALTVTATTTTTATLSWTETTPTAATRWEVAYGPVGFGDPEYRGTHVETTNNNGFEVTGLNHTTKYEFYVRALCSASDKSPWSAVATGTTQCGTWQYSDMPLVENFDGYTGNTSGTLANHVMPNCWSWLNGGSNSTYAGLPSIYSTASYSHSSPNSLRFYTYYSSAYADQIAVLPQFGFSLDTLEISLYGRFYNSSSSIQVGVMSDPTDAETFEAVETLTAPSTGYSTQQLYEVSFSEYAGDARYVAFKVAKPASSYNGFYMDDLTVKLREKVNAMADGGQNVVACNEFVMPDTTYGGYHGGLNTTYVVRPAEAGKVAHLTGSYNLEKGYDFLNVYRGAVSANNLIGRYTGEGEIDYVTTSNLWADSGYFTLVLTTDVDNAFEDMYGFKLLVSCECPQPAAEVIAETVEANGTYTWRNGETYENNIVRTGLVYDGEAMGIVEPDLQKSVEYTYYNVAGCDSVSYSLTLTLHPTYHLTYDAQLCERDTFAFYGENYVSTGSYTVNKTSQDGADSIGVLNLQLNPAPTVGIYYNNRLQTAVDAYCDNADMTIAARSNVTNATFEWEDESSEASRVVNPHESSVYTVVATNPTTGCTSLPATLTVTTVPVPELSISGDSAICYGQSTTLTLADANDVDATYRWSTGATTTSITVSPTETTTYSVTATTANASACTATAEFTVTVNALPEVEAVASVGEICRDSVVTLTASQVEGYSYSWNTGATTAVATVAAASTGAYTVTVTDQNGCVNEFTTAAVTVYPSYEIEDQMSVCYTNNPYTWGEQTITENGNYDQTFTIAHGCDSVVHLAFTFEEMGVENSNIERCYGDGYTFNGASYMANADTALYYIDNSGECPVRYNLAVTVHPVKTTELERTVCDSYLWPVSGETYTESGDYPVTLATTKGCDSTVTMHLTVNYQNTGIETVTACDNYVWNLNGVSYTASTKEPTFTLQNQWGCDSVVTLDLTVNYRSYHEDFHCVRDAATYTWIDGETYMLGVEAQDGIEWVTGENAVGCNEIAQLHLVLNPVTDTLNWVTVEACDEYEIADAVVFDDEDDCMGHIEPLYLTESGDYEVRTRAADGHDQWTRVHLTVNRSTYHTTVVTACLPYTWTILDDENQPYEVATITAEDVNDASVYNMSVDMAEAGYVASTCSNIQVLRLTPKYPSVETIEATICQNGSWIAENNTIYYGSDLNIGENAPKTWDNSETNADGCPLTKQVVLTVNPTYADVMELAFCESDFVLNEESGDYELAVADEVANHTNEPVVLTIPGALNEVEYSNSVDAYWTTALGCDSTVTINYTVYPTVRQVETETVCYSDHFVWDANEKLYDEPGTYTESIDTENPLTGCKLVRELNLTVLGTYEHFDTVNVCTTYEGPDGVTYRETKTFDEPFTGSYDETAYCDAITHRTYNVMQNTLTEHFVLTNADYTWMNGVTYTENADNVYYDAPVAEGCDDVHLLHLTMTDPISVCENELPYSVSFGNSTYTIPADAANNGTLGNGEDTILYYTVLRNTVNTIAQTACDSYTWTDGDNLTYTESGEYVYTTTNVAGCDSVVTLALTVNVSTADTVEVTACDSYTWTDGDGETYTESGEYVYTTTNVAGCDSVVTLALTINVNNGVEQTEVACATYTWEVNGATYTESGDYTVTYTDANGCSGDSVLHLTINPVDETNTTLVVNEAGSYTYLGVMYTAPYDDIITHTFTNQYGCDSIDHLHLIIPVVADDQIVVDSVEACGTYTWTIAGVDHTYEWMSTSDRQNHGMALYKDVTFNKYIYTYPTDTIFDANGVMTSVRVLYLNLLEATYSTETVDVPVSFGSYTINGVAGNVEGTAVATLNFAYADRGTSIDTTVGVGSVAYCDDYRTYTINLIDNYDTTEVFACADETTYEWNGTSYTIGTPGHTFEFIQKENEGTLDELVHVLKVNQRAVNAIAQTETACDSYTWTSGDSLTYTASGVYVYNYTDANQCAATKTLNLTVNYNSSTGYNDAACDTYTWARNNQTYTASGDYTYSYTAENGCASTDTLHLTIDSNSNQTFTEVACNSYMWAAANGGDDVTYTTSGTYTYNYTAENGCPSVNTLSLTINLPTNTAFTETACDSIEWNGTKYYTDGTYTYDYTSEAGCASTDTLFLTVKAATHNSESMVQCDSYVWNGTTYTESGIYTFQYNNDDNCPSVDTLHLTINVNNTGVEVTETACDDYTWDISNRLYTTSGDYTARTTDENGCATTNTLHLTINHTSSYDSVLYISDGSYRYTYQDGHQELFGEGVYNLTETYTNVEGCDSTLNITLNIGTALLAIDNVVNCNEYTWRNGETYVFIDAAERTAHLNNDGDAPLYKASNGTYIYYNPTYTVHQENGYDSIYMLALTLNQSYQGYFEATVNVSEGTYNYIDEDRGINTVLDFSDAAAEKQNFVNEDREYDVHFNNPEYCDGVMTVTLHLVNNYQEVVADAADICVSQESFTWRDTITISTATTDYDNVHTYYVYDEINSDGIIEYITVTQHPITYTTERRTACDEYTWYGTTYTESTSNATQYLAAGTELEDGTVLVCDRVVTLMLTINHNTSTTYDVAACEEYIWTAANGGDGETYTESGTYTYDYNTVQGCPSTNTLNLTINHNTSTEYTVDACDSYTWTAEEGGNGTVYTTSSTAEGYTYDYLTEDGCPSTNTLYLTIRNNSNQIFTETACDTYTWSADNGGNGETYTESGVYTYDYEAENGCPSTNTLNLTVNVNSSTEYTESVCDSYTWHGQTYTASGDYTYDYADANNCPSEDVLHLTVNNSTLNVMSVVECNSYTWEDGDGLTYTASGAYEYVHTDDNGCTVTDSLYLTIGTGRAFGIARVTNCGPYTWVVEGDTIAVLEESVETSTSVTNPATGCDSTIFLYLTINPQNVTEAVICDNGEYTWTVNNVTYTEAGIYDESETDDEGNCISSERLVLTVNPTQATSLTDQICLGNGYSANGFDIASSELTEAGEYTFIDSLTTVNGCDSIVTLTLTVGDIISNPVEATACDTYTWTAGDGADYTYTVSGTYKSEAYANAMGCTTVDVLTLTINQNAGTEYTETVCDSYMWNGTQYTESGDYTFDYTDGNGCASTDVLHLTVNSSTINTIPVTACDSYTWTNGDGETYTASGVYTYNYTTSDGCAGTDYLVLTINNSTNNAVEVTACDSYLWNDVEYTVSGVYTYDYTNADGCASTDTLVLTVNSNSDSVYTVTACDSYLWNGTVYTESGDYAYNYTNVDGCASTDTLHLTVNTNTNSAETVVACSSYDWNDVHYTQSGTFYHHYNTAEGCASVDTLYLTINNPVVAIVRDTACDSYFWPVNGETYTESAVYFATYEAANGCDSIIALYLTINNSEHSAETDTACGSYTWNGETYTTSGDYLYSYTAANGCVNVDTLHLTVNQPMNTTETQTACSSYIWNGETYTTSGTYTADFTDVNGCTATATLELTIQQPLNTTEEQSVCGSYTWRGETYTASGTYTSDFIDVNGCGATATLNLTILQPVNTTEIQTACSSYTWNGETYTTSGTYTTEITDVNGCDATATLYLTILQPANTTETMVACDSYTWNGQTYTTSGVYTASFTDVNGCEATATLNLTVNAGTTGTETATACGSYTWHGETYTTSGTYTYQTVNVNGCDSTVTLTLTVNQPMNTTETQTACSSYIWNGETYTTSGTYTTQVIDENGCIATATLNLTIQQPQNTTETQTACSSYTWRGETYTTSGTYTSDFVDVNGCGATATLNLTIQQPVNTTEMQTACSSYTWNGETYTTSGTYTAEITDANGCDATATLYLTILQPANTTETTVACDSYVWNGQTYTTSGTYTSDFVDVNGCDATATLNLTVNASTTSAETVTTCGSYTWHGETYTTSGSYTYQTVNAAGCDSTVTLNLTIGTGLNTTEDISACDSYLWNGTEYTVSGTYTWTGTSVDGCDSTVTLNLTVNHSADTTLYLQGEGTIEWNGETFTESGVYVYTLTTANGCDSVVTLNLAILPVGVPAPYLYNVMDVVLTINHNDEGMEDVHYIWYRWYRDGELVLEGPDKDSYSEDGRKLNGCYYLEVATDETMQYWVRSNEVCINNVGIDEVAEFGFTIAPNPVQRGSIVTVSAEAGAADLQGAEIRIFDVQGRLVLKQANNGTFVADMPTGMYMVRLTLNDGRNAVRRLIVK